MKAKIRKDAHGNRRVAEPTAAVAGTVAAIITAVNSGDWTTAITLFVVGLLPYAVSLVTDARRAA